MKIDNSVSIGFQSKANPIPFSVINTKRGKLRVAEVREKDLRSDIFVRRLTRFFSINFASLTNDPEWSVFKKRNNGIEYERAFQDILEYYSGKLRNPDKNMTLLLARDKRNKIQGACFSYGVKGILDAPEEVCYIDSIAVNPSYRGYNIGKMLMEKTMNSAKNTFGDVFLFGDRVAIDFYKKLGFSPMDEKDLSQKAVIDYISMRRCDYPKYVELLTKPLDVGKERWYTNIAGYLNEWNLK